MSKKMKIKFTDIQWDCDGETPEDLGLPETLVAEVDVDTDGDIVDSLGKFLSDEYGYCVEGFCWYEHDEAPDMPSPPTTEIPKMKISEFVEELKRYQSELGDIQVIGWNTGECPVIAFADGCLTIEG